MFFRKGNIVFRISKLFSQDKLLHQVKSSTIGNELFMLVISLMLEFYRSIICLTSKLAVFLSTIFKGKVRTIHLQGVADKVKNKLVALKVSLLSIPGTVQLVKYVIQSMLIHTLSIYSWHVSLMMDLKTCIRNFIWSGISTKENLSHIFLEEGLQTSGRRGLGIRSLILLNV